MVVVAAASGVPDRTRVPVLKLAHEGAPVTLYVSGALPPVPTGKVTLKDVPTVPDWSATAGAVGCVSGAVVVTCALALSLPPVFVAVRVTVRVPALP